METCWPDLRFVTPAPTEMTVPENSWPNVMGIVAPVTGCGDVGAKLEPPRYSWGSGGVRFISTIEVFGEVELGKE
jgi:hypothetical protein